MINNLENEITEDYTGVENVNLEDSDFDEFGYNTASSTIGGFSPPVSLILIGSTHARSRGNMNWSIWAIVHPIYAML